LTFFRWLAIKTGKPFGELEKPGSNPVRKCIANRPVPGHSFAAIDSPNGFQIPDFVEKIDPGFVTTRQASEAVEV